MRRPRVDPGHLGRGRDGEGLHRLHLARARDFGRHRTLRAARELDAKAVVAAAYHGDRVGDLADLARRHHLAALAFALHAHVVAGDVAVGAEAEAALPGQDGEGLRRRRRLLDGLLHVEAAQEHPCPFGVGDGRVPGSP
jgi:hypothetical protein